MKNLHFIFMLLFSPCYSISQISIENNQDIEFYVKEILMGKGVIIDNLKFVGKSESIGQFNCNNTALGVSSGLILSTGNTNDIIGPNDSEMHTSYGLEPNSYAQKRKIKKGDKDLNRLCRNKTRDITLIEFDFIPYNNVISFNYVFGSEEYPEFIESRFNDVFGFFLSGPDIEGKVNLAVLPDDSISISIYNVNHKNNKSYYIKNHGRLNQSMIRFKEWWLIHFSSDKQKLENQYSNLYYQCQLDGITKVLNVSHSVSPGKKYHIKIAIGDVGDTYYDSAVFLESGSFKSIINNQGKYYQDVISFQMDDLNIDSIFGKKNNIEIEKEIIKIDSVFETTEIYFEENERHVSSQYQEILNDLIAYLSYNEEVKCAVYGFTNNNGSVLYNQTLSEDRANAVANYLINSGLESDRIEIVGFGIDRNKYDNETNTGKVKNRRVEIILE